MKMTTKMPTTTKSLLTTMAILFALIGCESAGDAGRQVGGGTRAEFCKSGDTPVESPGQCLQDDAACYQLTNGTWCTGERGQACPTGSTPLPAGTECPQGGRCFTIGENLTCSVIYGSNN